MIDAPVVRTEGLTKRYGAKLGCSDVSLTVGRGQVFGFLGRNGAGKSTFVKMMVGLIAPTTGRGELLGRPLGDADARHRVGYLPEVFRYQDWMSPLELLAFHGRLLGLEPTVVAEDARRVLADVGLAAEGGAKIRSFSKGMQQRFGLACALLGQPDVVFLDEPTSALDPVGRAHVRELLVRVRERGATVFLNSHLLSEVELVCDEIAFIDAGRVVEAGPLRELLGRATEVEVGLAAPLPQAVAILGADGYRVVSAEDRRLVVALPDDGAVPRLVQRLVGAGALVEHVSPRTRSLESLFLERVGEGIASA